MMRRGVYLGPRAYARVRGLQGAAPGRWRAERYRTPGGRLRTRYRGPGGRTMGQDAMFRALTGGSRRRVSIGARDRIERAFRILEPAGERRLRTEMPADELQRWREAFEALKGLPERRRRDTGKKLKADYERRRRRELRAA